MMVVEGITVGSQSSVDSLRTMRRTVHGMTLPTSKLILPITLNLPVTNMITDLSSR